MATLHGLRFPMFLKIAILLGACLLAFYAARQSNEASRQTVSFALSSVRRTAIDCMEQINERGVDSEEKLKAALYSTNPQPDYLYDIFSRGETEVKFRLPVGVEGYRDLTRKRAPLMIHYTRNYILIASAGPDRRRDIEPNLLSTNLKEVPITLIYDSTNGTVSSGDIVHLTHCKDGRMEEARR